MKQLTPMQELLNDIFGENYIESENCAMMYSEFLDKERQAIIDAFDNGYDDGTGMPVGSGKYIIGKEFFNQTYKSE